MTDNTAPLHIAICEDLAEDAALLKNCINESGMPVVCRCFDSGEAFLKDFRANQYELLFLDIYMEGMQGVEVAKVVRERDKNLMIAFTTASIDHTLEGYRLGVLKYLEKPVTAANVNETLEIALMKRNARPFITLTAAGGGSVSILRDSIQYFEQKGNNVEVHTGDHVFGASQSVRMKNIEKTLPSPPFFRCHRSFIVNLHYVRKLDRSRKAFFMENGAHVDIRRGDVLRYKQILDGWRLSEAGRIEL